MCGDYAMHYIPALQWGNDKKYLKTVATAKHYADYDQEGTYGTDRQDFDAVVNARDQAEYFLPPFEAAIKGGHAESVMCAYNAVNGVPACGSKMLQTELLREKWGFDGFVTSDCDALSDGAFNKYADKYFNGSRLQQTRIGVQAGTDIDCGGLYGEQVVEAVESGILPVSDVDKALSRVYEKSFKLGLLDRDVSYTKLGPESVDTPSHRRLALEAARQGIVLLKNEKGALPLSLEELTAGGKVAMIGPHANASVDLLGNTGYRGENTYIDTHTPLSILGGRIGADRIEHVRGCDIATNDTSGIATAVSAASEATVSLIFLGIDGTIEDEAKDREHISLPGVQEQLLQAVAKVSAKTILVLVNGGAVSVGWAKEDDSVSGILEAWYPGMLGAEAITDVLLGDVSPSGRLPVTIYKSSFVASRRLEDMDLRSREGVTYRYFTGEPLWPFGFGLSYTTFSYEWKGIESTTKQYSAGDIRAEMEGGGYYASRGQGFRGPSYSVVVTNTGDRQGAVSVLGFIEGKGDGIVKELFGYERIDSLMPGHSATLHFTIPPHSLARVDDKGDRSLHTGTYRVRIGTLATDLVVRR